MYILEHVRIHPLDSFPGRCQDTHRNGPPPFTSHAMVRSPDPPMVKSKEPLEVTQWMSPECRVLVLGPTSRSLKDFDLNMAAKPVKYGQKWIYILISMESFNLNTLSLRFGDTKWEKSIEHQFFWPHLTALNVVSICSLCTLRMYTASVEGVGWCCGQCLATKGANVMPNFWEEMLNCFHITSSLRFVTICRTFDKHDGYSKVRCYSVLSLLSTTSAMNDRKSWLPNASNQHSQTKTFENIGQVCHDIA